MTEQKSGEQLVRLDDGEMYVAMDGPPDAPVLLLIHGTAASTVSWDPVVPLLAGAFLVVRVDLLGCGRSSTATGGYDVPAQARRTGAALDRLGVRRATVVGHSGGCMVATALAEQRPDLVAGVVLIDMGPTPDAKYPESPLAGVVMAPVVGPLLWRFRSPATLRKAASTAFTRPVEVPDAFFEHMMRMRHRTFTGLMRGLLGYLRERGLPDRLAPLGQPLLVIFGAEDRRWRASSAEAYRVVPNVRIEVLPELGHSPMVEDPETTGALLIDFASALPNAATARRGIDG
jgi:pimeloyl-ACP methyl ester carboxylesterase